MRIVVTALVTCSLLVAIWVDSSCCAESVTDRHNRGKHEILGATLAAVGVGLATAGFVVDLHVDTEEWDGGPANSTIDPLSLYVSGATMIGLGALIYFLDRDDVGENGEEMSSSGEGRESRWQMGAYRSCEKDLGLCIRAEF
jgi:hypothetical protein